MLNALTIDVEDYYSVFARDWLGVDSRPTEAVVRNTSEILAILADRGVSATFFVLGEVAETFPKLMRDIAADGHEVGVHGYYHKQFFKLAPEQARKEVGDAKKLLEDIIGQAVEGHRAPAFSIRPDTKWALEILAELGFRYDSSIHPKAGKRYGWRGFREDIHQIDLPSGAKLIEAPISVVHVLGKVLRACGGGYIRHFPYWYTRWAMRRIQRLRPAIVYMHPYEIDTSAAHAEFVSALENADKSAKRFHGQQLRNRRTMKKKLVKLLKNFEFAPLGRVINQVLSVPKDQ